MNNPQKDVNRVQLNNEKDTLNKLKGIYQKALDDINNNIAQLMGRTDVENLQSIIYQVEYQKALKSQINGILDDLNTKQFTTISEYLTESYENGFIGTMYDLHKQDIPLIFPINQEQVVQAVQLDSKTSEGLYKKLGEDTTVLKKRIANNVSRGFAQGSSYFDIAKNIAGGMVGYNAKNPGGALARAMRISRTEGNRIYNKSHFDAQHKAKANGADIVKQWDAALDARTRDSHAKVDGEIRDLDKPFSNGLLYPGDPDGKASEVVNCRCALLQRAKWDLDEEELQILQERAEYFGLDKTKNFEEFKEKYLKSVDKVSVEEYNNSKEMYRKKGNSEKNFNFIDNERFEALTIEARKKGAQIIKGTEEVERHLDNMNASASTVGNVLMFRNKVTISDVLEETFHYSQNLNKANEKVKEPIKTILNEIDAKQYLIDNAKKYKIPRKEVELTKKQLEGYKKQLKSITKGN